MKNFLYVLFPCCGFNSVPALSLLATGAITSKCRGFGSVSCCQYCFQVGVQQLPVSELSYELALLETEAVRRNCATTAHHGTAQLTELDYEFNNSEEAVRKEVFTGRQE